MEYSLTFAGPSRWPNWVERRVEADGRLVDYAVWQRVYESSAPAIDLEVNYGSAIIDFRDPASTRTAKLSKAMSIHRVLLDVATLSDSPSPASYDGITENGHPFPLTRLLLLVAMGFGTLILLQLARIMMRRLAFGRQA